MPQQIVMIHGGDTFETYEEYLKFLHEFEVDAEYIKRRRRWKDWLIDELGEAYELIAPQMPNQINAKYAEWKIWFEKLLPFVNDGVILIGNSLGGIFLAKYLAQEKFPKKIKALFLLAAPFDTEESDYTLADFTLPASLQGVSEQCGQIFLYQSSDDPIVPPRDCEKYLAALPRAIVRRFSDRGHFSVAEFPELAADIKNLA